MSNNVDRGDIYIVIDVVKGYWEDANKSTETCRAPSM